MGNESILLYEVDSTWRQLTAGHGTYVNNGTLFIYVQRLKDGVPAPTARGIKIRPGETFSISHDTSEYTYLRTFAGTSEIARYDDPRRDISGVTSLIDDESGNQALINDDGGLMVSNSFKDVEDGTYNDVSIQNPLPTDGDSVYEKDVRTDLSSAINWIDEDSTGLSPILIPFTDLHTRISNSTTDNPKSLLIHFHRTVSLDQVGLGCTDELGNFSNVKIIVLGSGGIERTALDDSSNNTKLNSKNYQFGPELGNAIRIEFHTSDPVCLSNITIQKVTKTATRIQAIKPDGSVTDIGATSYDNLKVSIQEYGDTPSIDPFGALRVSNPFTLFDSKQLHDKQPLFWDEEIGGSATSIHSAINAATSMAVTANAADYVIRQTKQRFNYQPGKGQKIFFTFLCDCSEGITRRMGLFDCVGINYLTPNNGVFFQTTSIASWNIAKNGTITESVNQSDWNVDKLDGTGASGITIDFSGVQIGIIDYEWLGVGRVRVGFVVDGLIYYCHYFNHANAGFDSVYMSTPNLPLRYSIESDGTGAGKLDHICSTIISEGGQQKTGILRSIDQNATYITGLGAGTTYALIGLRLKDLYKDITIIPESLNVIAGTNDDLKWSLHINPTIAGTFTYTDLLNSATQYAIGTNANTISDVGIVIDSGYASKESKQTDAVLNTALKIGSTIAGVQDELVLCVTPISANLSVLSSLSFRELL